MQCDWYALHALESGVAYTSCDREGLQEIMCVTFQILAVAARVGDERSNHDVVSAR